jgi:glycosyltransferase involved in cell wall biosynthesis
VSARAARAVVCVSETVAELVRATFRPRALHVVPNAGDHLVPLPRAAGAGAALVAIGHLEPRKNLELVLRALALDPSLPALELAGSAKEGEEQRLRALVSELGLAARVRFLGPLDERELVRLLARAAAVVMPSRLEGFGIGVLEAQLARVPLAVANVGALPEVAGEGVPRFAPDDAAACARAVHAALAQPEATLAEHAERARRYSWERSAELLVACWKGAARG